MTKLKEKKIKIFRNQEMEDQPFPEIQSYKLLAEKPTELADINPTEGEELEQNVIDIATNVTDIAGNATNIVVNATGIAVNVTDISGNASNITINAMGISTNVSDIAGNVTNITQNATDISINATDISGNAASIVVNASAISLNVSDISGNTSNITINATQISTNVSDISGNTSNITQNATDISLNATDIAGNTANITINATQISTNVSDISGNSSDITQNATNIGLRIKTHAATGADEVIAEINLSTEGIYIAGDRIQLSGDTEILGDFAVSGDAVVGGAITGVTIQTAASGQRIVLEGAGGALGMPHEVIVYPPTGSPMEIFGGASYFYFTANLAVRPIRFDNPLGLVALQINETSIYIPGDVDINGDADIDGVVDIGGTHLSPKTDNHTYVGSSTLGYKSFYFTDAYDPKIYRGADTHLKFTSANLECYKNFTPDSGNTKNLGSTGDYWAEVHYHSLVSHTPKILVRGLSLLETIKKGKGKNIDKTKLASSFRHKEGGILMDNIIMANTAAIKEIDSKLKELKTKVGSNK